MSLGCGGKRWPWKVDWFVENLVDFFGTLFWFLDESWNSWKISGRREIFFECWGLGTRSSRRRRQQWLRQHILGLAAQPDPISPQLTRIGWKITDRQILAREGQQLQDKNIYHSNTRIGMILWANERSLIWQHSPVCKEKYKISTQRISSSEKFYFATSQFLWVALGHKFLRRCHPIDYIL